MPILTSRFLRRTGSMIRPTRPFGSPANVRLGAVALLVTYLLYLTWNSTPTWHQYGKSKFANVCSPSSGLDRVVITVKTGATEALKKVPIQLQTSLKCAPHVYVYSDKAQKLGSLEIYDALDTIPAAVKDGNLDFELYRKQQEIEDPKELIETLHNFKHPNNNDDVAAWVLDKYKNTHIVEKVWDRMPDKDWYFHIDADTYVFLPTLASWLRKLDPSKESLIGSVALIVGKEFAHGGSGILLSNAATRKFVIGNNGTAAKWDSELKNNCCGDWVLAQIFHQYGISVTQAFPMVFGEGLGSIRFSPEFWCQSVSTLHHISPSEVERISKFEQRRREPNAPVSFSELFYGLVFESIPSEPRLDWDNSSDEDTITANVKTMEACIAICASNADCLQLRFNGDECAISTIHVKLGAEHKPKDKDEKQWQSSWNRTRIAEWATKQSVCKDPVYPF